MKAERGRGRGDPELREEPEFHNFLYFTFIICTYRLKINDEYIEINRIVGKIWPGTSG